MDVYYLERNKNNDGFYYVHKDSCKNLSVDRGYLGFFENGEDALLEAVKLQTNTKLSECCK